ncbi:hypothetical protein [Peijinzhouia sedimentorum]
MSIEKKTSIFDLNSVEVHYWFNDNTHLMDAFIQNRCEYELLGILKEISSTFKIEIIIETKPLENGGLRRWFKLASREENKKATITTAVVTALLTTILVTPLSTTISKLTEKAIEKIFEDPELIYLEKQKLKFEIEKLKQETGYNIQTLDGNNVVKKKKSNFYNSLDKYKKVEKVTFTLTANNKKPIEEQTVPRAIFKEFILVTDELEPEVLDDVVIEIISPVLKKGTYKWMGIYKGEPVPFSMKSKEFKELVQKGDIQFKNGTSINCSLIIKKKIDNEGIEKIINIEVYRVNHYFENDKPIETPEGRTNRKNNEAEKQQLNLFPTNNDTN